MDNYKEIDLESMPFSSYMIATKTGYLKEINSFINKRDDLSAANLKVYSKELKTSYNNLINQLLTMVIKYDLESFIDMSISELYEKYSYDEIDKYKESIEFKIINECVFPLPDYLQEISKTMVVDSIISIKNNISHNSVLIKALSLAEKYLENLSKTINLSIKSFNFLAFSLIDSVCSITYQSFNLDEYEEYLSNYYKKEDKLKDLESEIYLQDSFEDKGKFEQAMLYAKSSKLKLELSDIKSNFNKKIIGINTLETFKEINNINKKLDFEEFKKMIKLEFDVNVRENESNEQLKYLLWIIHLNANKKSDTLAFQDKFILDNMIIPWSEELKDLIEEDFDQSNFNVDEAINYIGRLRTKGEYSNTPQGRKYKLTALKKVFCLMDKQYTKADVLVLNKEILNADYSVRTGLIIQAMREMGTEKNPVIKSNRGLTITKYGISCSPKAIVLFNYLLGQFVENGANTTKILLNEEFYRGLNLSNGRGNNLKDIKQQIGAIAGQYIYIDDEKDKDKATKQIKGNLKKVSVSNLKTKGTSLIDIKYTEIEGQDAIVFTIPLMKMFCSHKQHDRLVDAKAIEHWSQKPRILLITRELGKLSRNKREHTLSIETLLRNIGEWERYKNYADKKKYFQRLNKDINKAIDYMKTDKSFKYSGCTNGTFKEARIIYE